MKQQNNKFPQEKEDEGPPAFSSWKGWYWLLILNLIFWILALYFFTSYYS